MRSLLAAGGVDYDQWKALTVAALKTDFRAGSFGRSHAHRKRAAQGTAAIIVQLIFYSFLGAVIAIGVTWINDLSLAGLVVLTYVIFMVGTGVLVDHNSAVTSPNDYLVLGFQPITSRTYFAARLANVLVYMLAMTTAFALVPIAAFFIRWGVVVGAAALLAVYACATAITLTIVMGYAWMLRVMGPRRLRSALSLVQLLVGTGVYGGYLLVSRVVSRSVLETMTMPRTPWLLAYPATWFASYLQLAAGNASWTVLVPALASLALLAALAFSIRGRLSLEYSERLGALVSSSEARQARSARLRPGRWFRGGESRAIAILVRSQFRNDMRFRMGVLGILPMTLIYLFMGLQQRGPATSGAGSAIGNLSMVSVAVFLFPAMLKLNLGRSDAFRASWIFFSSPADRTRLVRSAKNAMVAFFLVPYLLFVGALLLYFMDNTLYVVVYLLLAGLMSHFLLLTVTLIDPELPFSRPWAKTQGSFMVMATIMAVSMFGALLPFGLRYVYRSVPATAVAFLAVIVASLVVDRLTRVRVERQAARLEFSD